MLAFAERAPDVEGGRVEAINRIGCSGDSESFSMLSRAMRSALAARRVRFADEGVWVLDAIDGWKRANARIYLACSPPDHPGAAEDVHYGPQAAAAALAAYRDVLAALPIPMRVGFRNATVQMVTANAKHVVNTVGLAARMGNGTVAARGAMLIADFVAWGSTTMSATEKMSASNRAAEMRAAASAVIASAGRSSDADGESAFKITVVENALGPDTPGFYFRLSGQDVPHGPHPTAEEAIGEAAKAALAEAVQASSALDEARKALVLAEARYTEARARVDALGGEVGPSADEPDIRAFAA
jgi:hypothetical protein